MLSYKMYGLVIIIRDIAKIDVMKMIYKTCEHFLREGRGQRVR
jgi:hypothetical protein